jgi:tRNA-specific 2-thiouridylase
MYYTRGQRQGLQLGGVRGGSGDPWYVADKDLENNILYVVQGHDHGRLHSRWLLADDVHWIAGQAPSLPVSLYAKTRYRQQDLPCRVEEHGAGGLKVEFEDPQWAVTPGQAVVFYDGEVCLGGATIIGAEHLHYGRAA